MKFKKIILFFILILFIIGLTIFLFPKKHLTESQITGLGATFINLDGTISDDNPTSYEVTIDQYGGVNSTTTKINIINLTSKIQSSIKNCPGYFNSQTGYCYDYLNPVENWMSIVFRLPQTESFGGEPDWILRDNGMWVYCRDGYVVSNAQSPTNNGIDNFLEGVPKYGSVLDLINKPDNIIQYECDKSNL